MAQETFEWCPSVAEVWNFAVDRNSFSRSVSRTDTMPSLVPLIIMYTYLC